MYQFLNHYGVWTLCTIAMVVILVAMIRRQLLDEYGLFFWYIAAHALEAIVSFIVKQTSYTLYFYTYWGWEVIDAIFTLIVLQFVFVKVFDSYKALHGLGVTLFRWATIVLCLFAIVIAIYAPADAGMGRLMAGLMVMERSIQLIQLGLLLCLLLCSRLLGLPWRHYIYGINLGFGIYAAVALIASAINAQEGYKFKDIWSRLIGFSYSVGVFTWTYYFVSRKAVEVSAKPPASAHLEQWNTALTDILHR